MPESITSPDTSSNAFKVFTSIIGIVKSNEIRKEQFETLIEENIKVRVDEYV